MLFSGDSYPHDLEIKTTAHTLTIPLALEWQVETGPVWMAFKAGGFWDVFLTQKIGWYPDGEADNGNHVPAARKKPGDMGLLGGVDLGVRIQRMGVLVGLNYEHSLTEVVEFPAPDDYYGYYSSYPTISGASALRCLEIHAGLRWFLLK